jgi:hypothetical protein
METNLLNHIFTNADITLIGDATGLRGSTTVGSLYISLHTADPGEAGDQTTSEATYTGYARVAVARTGSAWTVATNSATNAAAITFPTGSGGSGTITHVGVGASASGTGKLIGSGTVSPNVPTGNGITPEFAINQLTITLD